MALDLAVQSACWLCDECARRFEGDNGDEDGPVHREILKKVGERMVQGQLGPSLNCTLCGAIGPDVN